MKTVGRTTQGLIWVVVATALLAALPAGASAQSLLERSPNLSGGWVDEPGALHFHLVHRFWLARGGGDDKLVNSPTMLAALPLPGRILVGTRYASNSLVVPGRFNEWELFARWSHAGDVVVPGSLSLSTGYNGAAGSFDAELATTVFMGRLTLLGSVRGFSDARGSGDPGWAAAGGGLLRLRDHVSLAGDLGTLVVDGTRQGSVWGAGLQLRIPTTPHTLSIQATNARTGTLQGASTRDRTTWGFEFTVPVTFARYFAAARSPVEASDGDDGTVHVTMDRALRFVPDTIEIQVGDTVVWSNPTPEVHTVTAHPERVRDPESIQLPEGAEPFDSGNMFEGDIFRHVFSVPGTYVYVCVPHDLAGMVGTVIVR